ncbi:AAA family ATPase [Nocardia uniformis]|uniref:AAA family ATPase n=1 Tax=Nocardia uniformis TaxID=53432 RepID=A0A849C680_9NOCA|nr:AAA family ATPase [Nocardia uniformis]
MQGPEAADSFAADAAPGAGEQDSDTTTDAADAVVDEAAEAQPSTSDAEPESGSGFFPPVPDSLEQGSAQPEPGSGQEDGFPQPGPFAPPGAPSAETTSFAPPSGPYSPPGAYGAGDGNPYGPNGPFEAQPGFAPPPFAGGQQFPPNGFPQTGSYPAPDQGQWTPPGSFPGQPGFPPPGAEPGGSPSGSYGEIRQETPYGEIRQEIGSDGMVRRVFADQQPENGAPAEQTEQFTGQPQQFAGQPEQTEQFGGPGQGFSPGADQPGGPIYSWSPPPAAPPQQHSQPHPLQQHSQPHPLQQHPQQQPHQNFQQPGWNNAPPQGYQQQGGPQQSPPPGHSVNDLNLLKRARRAPRGGWRRAVHKASGGVINPGESPADIVHNELVDRVNQPVRGDYRIAILSLKGGVGKTTTTVGLGSTFSSMRGDRVIAIDANPDLGTLAHRVPRQTRSTVRNLLEDQHISRYSDVRAHTSQAPSRLEVLASEQDPAVSEAFSEADYRKAIGILQQFYNIILTDCGTGLMHSAMAGVLDMASSLVLVTSPAIDGARSASATLDWLDHHGYHKLVERTVVVVNASRKGSSTVDLDQLRKLFLDRTRAVQVVPFDDHLAEGAEIDLELVGKPTQRALLELAAMVADDFGYHAAQQGPYSQR